ncbi:pyridoxal phosphate-dependent aminotransferase [Brevibacterium moorei]|uniref:pyridoxal phosphate-dependent aminotransferase n=1 Tax=Brevibacterium moorei TaxID=2968457 RepID=UPI00211C07B1|nr:aminotransferase class I/II-fold pyridoxal phosphate-dependent enzyme [Brevibacterium sp. 68QC2CO]MCQ9385469.1 aminotransferase class I/II-fold pyridoxal phosphate-dependent enzyme [Brevibacterium sp. 68QC2CO]
MYFSPAIADMPASGIRRIGELAAARPGTITLQVGEPDADTPANINAAAAKAMADGHTHYEPNAGIVPLRKALAHKVTTVNRVPADWSNIVVTNGAVEGLFTVLASVAQAGDAVMIPDPSWPNYSMMAKILGVTEQLYPMDTHTGAIDVAVLEAMVTPETRAIMINSPSNPLGTLLSAENLREIYDFAAAHDLWILADEVYDQLVFNGTMVSMGRIEAEALGLSDEQVPAVSRVISVYSFSKTYAMTGWRVGYLVVPDALTDALTKIQEPVVSCVNTPAQYAALEALTGPQDFVTESRARYGERAKLAERLFADAGIDVTAPDGAFYLWVDTHGDAQEIAEKLVIDHGVAVGPGPAFGPSGKSAIRLALASSEADLTEGIRRIINSGLIE